MVEKIAIIIPARYASTRFPGKPLADINGKPMIQHVYERAKLSNVDSVIIATDDERIEKAVKAFNGNVMLTGEHKTGTDRIAEVASKIDADIIINVQGDEPLIHPETINLTLQPLLDNPDLLVTNAVEHMSSKEDINDINNVKSVIDANSNILYFSRLAIPNNHTTTFKQLGLYAFRKQFLFQFSKWEQTPLEKIERVEMLRALENGQVVKATVTPHKSVSVDLPEDLEKVKAILNGK
jgi:3-deoxy-manno-octulosonate cytidylyltransferase (CMP-KDO synthetase)